MDTSYEESRGHAPSLVTLAQSGAVFYVANRPGNAPSHQDAAEWIDNAIDLGRAERAAGVHTRGHRFLRSIDTHDSTTKCGRRQITRRVHADGDMFVWTGHSSQPGSARAGAVTAEQAGAFGSPCRG
jgi:hypothetical protein